MAHSSSAAPIRNPGKPKAGRSGTPKAAPIRIEEAELLGPVAYAGSSADRRTN